MDDPANSKAEQFDALLGKALWQCFGQACAFTISVAVVLARIIARIIAWIVAATTCCRRNRHLCHCFRQGAAGVNLRVAFLEQEGRKVPSIVAMLCGNLLQGLTLVLHQIPDTAITYMGWKYSHGGTVIPLSEGWFSPMWLLSSQLLASSIN